MVIDESLNTNAEDGIPDMSCPGAYNCQFPLAGVVKISLYSPGDSLSLLTDQENAVLSWDWVVKNKQAKKKNK